MKWPEGRPKADAPKDGTSILVLDDAGEYRVISWNSADYFGGPWGWIDVNYRHVSWQKWWPLPLPENQRPKE